MTLGMDLDGCLADFNTAYIKLILEMTGVDLFPPRPFPITEWDYPEGFGYTEPQLQEVWNWIEHDPSFWRRLPVYAHAPQALDYLLASPYHDLYFLTTRRGKHAKYQTEQWLRSLHVRLDIPTVLLSSAKGHLARGLKLDVFIDDRPENCEAVRRQSPRTRVMLFDQPWNANAFEGESVMRITEIPGCIERYDAVYGPPTLESV